MLLARPLSPCLLVRLFQCLLSFLSAHAAIYPISGRGRGAFLWSGVQDGTYHSGINVYDLAMQWLYDAGIVVVCSSGNSDEAELFADIPRGSGGAATPLIVVGNANEDNTKYTSSTWRNREGPAGILTLYNRGANVDCATRTPQGRNWVPASQDAGTTYRVEPPGSSQATAITAGMIAYYLSQPFLYARFQENGIRNVAAEVKRFLIQTSREMKGNIFPNDPRTPTVPRAALGAVVPCQGGTPGRPPLGPLFTPAAGFARTLATSDVTHGTQVVANPLPQVCPDLSSATLSLY